MKINTFDYRLQGFHGKYLDMVGEAYRAIRKPGEDDAAYRLRIAAQALAEPSGAVEPETPPEPPARSLQQMMDDKIAESAIDRIDRMFGRGRKL